MNQALMEARKAYALGEIPIGAVIVKDDRLIASAHNLTVTLNDATAHAEMLAIRQACEVTGDWRLSDCELYVTAEPCTMCAGACVVSRIKKIYAGCMSPKYGACGSLRDVLRRDESSTKQNHEVAFESGILEEECAALMSQFFQERRQEAKAENVATC